MFSKNQIDEKFRVKVVCKLVSKLGHCDNANLDLLLWQMSEPRREKLERKPASMVLPLKSR